MDYIRIIDDYIGLYTDYIRKYINYVEIYKQDVNKTTKQKNNIYI